MEVQLPDPIQKLADAIKGTAFQNQIFIVGGCLRDFVLFKRPLEESSDIDLVITCDLDELQAHLKDCGVVKKIQERHSQFGTIFFKIDNMDIEMVRARKEFYDPGSRKPTVEPATLEEDLLRRDFNINTLHLDISNPELNFTATVLHDITNKVIDTPVDPVETLKDDPLRILRAYRFAGNLEFKLSERLRSAIQQTESGLFLLSKEKIQQELVKILSSRYAATILLMMEYDGILTLVFPWLSTMNGVEQGRHHKLDVFRHTLEVLAHCSQNDYPMTVRIAALLHDVGKPLTWSRGKDVFDRVEGMIPDIHFYRHEDYGSVMAEKILLDLRFDRHLINQVKVLVREHMRLHQADTPRTYRRIHADLSACVNPEHLGMLYIADCAGMKTGDDFEHSEDKVKDFLNNVVAPTPAGSLSPITGKDLMDLGVEVGPKIGEFKDYLHQMVLEEKLGRDDREGAIEIVKGLMK